MTPSETLPTLVLASASPARRRLLRSAGLDPEVLVSGVDESVADGLPPAELVVRLAALKADAVLERLGNDRTLVIAADSVLDLDGVALGKPGTAAAARARWDHLSGRSGVLRTGHVLLDVAAREPAAPPAPAGTRVRARRLACVSTTVGFAAVDAQEAAAYAATGEPLAVAGAFTLDGFGGALVERVDGCVSNVLGLSLPWLRRALATQGVAISRWWPTAS